MTKVHEPSKLELVIALFECSTYVRELPSNSESTAILAHVLDVIERYMHCNRIRYGDDDSFKIFKQAGPLELKAREARAKHPNRQTRRKNHPVFK